MPSDVVVSSSPASCRKKPLSPACVSPTTVPATVTSSKMHGLEVPEPCTWPIAIVPVGQERGSAETPSLFGDGVTAVKSVALLSLSALAALRETDLVLDGAGVGP